jgi:hypothetical protein
MNLTYELKEDILEDVPTNRKTVFGGFYIDSRVVGHKWVKGKWDNVAPEDLAFAKEQVRLGKARNLKILK